MERCELIQAIHFNGFQCFETILGREGRNGDWWICLKKTDEEHLKTNVSSCKYLLKGCSWESPYLA